MDALLERVGLRRPMPTSPYQAYMRHLRACRQCNYGRMCDKGLRLQAIYLRTRNLPAA